MVFIAVIGLWCNSSFVEWSASERDKILGLQVECGTDRHAYSFSNGKDFAKNPIKDQD
jgi:hypothetical protein